MKILDKKILAKKDDTIITKIEVFAPDVAKKVNPGQFVVLMVKEEGERIPLTIVDKDLNKGSITLIIQEVGMTTKFLGRLNKGDSLYALLGPLGQSGEVKNFGHVILIGGGVGIAEIYPVARALKQAGNKIITILGTRTKSLLILKDELQKTSDELLIATDDGSYGKKGFTTDILKEILTTNPSPMSHNLIYAVGPIPMMKKVSEITRAYKIRTIVSLNALMVDATGMCGCCRVTVGSEVKFTCVDGPEFDGHLVDWEEFEKRSRMYIDKEKYICSLYKL